MCVKPDSHIRPIHCRHFDDRVDLINIEEVGNEEHESRSVGLDASKGFDKPFEAAADGVIRTLAVVELLHISQKGNSENSPPKGTLLPPM